MAPPQLGATFVPGGFDDYYMPEVVAPSPQRYVALTLTLTLFLFLSCLYIPSSALPSYCPSLPISRFRFPAFAFQHSRAPDPWSFRFP